MATERPLQVSYINREITGEFEGNQTENAVMLMRLSDAAIPAAASLIAIWAVASFSITEERAHEIRAELESRRGTLGGNDLDGDAEPAPA